MKIPSPTPALWPADRAGVLEIANNWFDPSRVDIDWNVIERMPVGEVVPPPVGETNLERPAGAVELSESIMYAAAMNSINYMFWDKQDGQYTRYECHGKVGALGMTDAFQRAWSDPQSPIAAARDRGIPLTLTDVQNIFGDIPAPQSRVVILNEVLLSPDLKLLGDTVANSALNGTATNFDTTLASTMAQKFPQAYGDELLKKSQLAVSAMWREARMAGVAATCELTAFADYQIPNVLRALGVLKYDAELAARIDRGDIIEENSFDEKAIRAASILAIEKIAEVQHVTVADVDYWVWLKRKEPTTPFHLTPTTAY